MKEKYVGKVKVPFCVHVENFGSGQRKELIEIYQELGFTRDWIAESYNYDGFDHNCEHDVWDSSEGFGENTTVYTLKELQAIINGVGNGHIAPSQPFLVETSDGWIPWSGGNCPVISTELVDVRFGGSSNLGDTKLARELRWEHRYKGTAGDITSYRIVDSAVASCSDDTTTLDEDEYVGIASGETGYMDSVGSSVKVTANISFDVVIKGQGFTLTEQEIHELYIQLCKAEGELQDWRLGE